MALSTLCTALANGPCAGVAVSGTVQVVLNGTFTYTASPDGVTRRCLADFQVSPDGTNWVSVPGGSTSVPTSFVADLGAGGQIRINVNNGGTGVSVNAYYGAV